VRGGEAVLAGDVDEGSPLGVGELYARLALCRRNQVAHGTIVRWRTPASMPTGRYSPGGQKAAAKGELPRNPSARSSQNSTSTHSGE
jgi:hypothetical protein